MTLRITIVATVVALAFLTPTTAVGTDSPFMRGVVVSCPRWGPIWGSPAMSQSLEELASLGVNWVAIHPYGWLKPEGSIRFEPANDLTFLTRATEIAAEVGIQLFWKPHLGYWGSFSHRGAIDFGDDPAAWGRFFRDYENFIVDQARFAEAAGVTVFAVGVELEGTVHYEDLWRRIISRVRQVYNGRIVYAANWDRIQTVPFWDAVDLLGVHAYFPLSDEDDPDLAALNRGWDLALGELEHISRSTGKPVLVAEVGYNTSPDAARTPWAYESVHSASANSLRARLIDLAITRLEQEEFIEGMFWWKWMPGEGRKRNFSMRDEEALTALRQRWAPAQRPTTAK
jgi:hypothetical protein